MKWKYAYESRGRRKKEQGLEECLCSEDLSGSNETDQHRGINVYKKVRQAAL